MPVYLFRTFVVLFHNLKTLQVNILQCWKLVKIHLNISFCFTLITKKTIYILITANLKKTFRALLS